MENPQLIALSAVVVIGVAAQCVASLAHLPAVLVLLAAGLACGPLSGWLQPDDMLGGALLPLVSLSVGMLLFEGGLSLRLSDLPHVRRVLLRLLTLGLLVNWLVAAVAAWLLLGLSVGLSALLAAVLVVTGPTVIGPILRDVRPHPRVAAVLRWEGIMIDPLGATFALLVFQVVLSESLPRATAWAFVNLGRTLLAGALCGGAGSLLVVAALRGRRLPEHLHSAFALMAVLAAFVTADHLQPESGLLATTVMGLTLANQRWVDVSRITDFHESVAILLVSSLFILLSAQVPRQELAAVGWREVAFVAVLVAVARPLAVRASWCAELSREERSYVANMAPRGIVAAAVSAVFQMELVERQAFPQAARLAPITFIVICGTVAWYSLLARPLARRLGLLAENPQGVLIIGAHRLARELAATLVGRQVRVLLLDTDRADVREAVLAGLEARVDNALAEDVADRLELHGIGQLLALTSNDEVNALACRHFAPLFGPERVYQPPPSGPGTGLAPRLTGTTAFGPEATQARLEALHADGWRVKATGLTAQFAYRDYQARSDGRAVPLYIMLPGRRLEVWCSAGALEPGEGASVIALVPPDGARE